MYLLICKIYYNWKIKLSIIKVIQLIDDARIVHVYESTMYETIVDVCMNQWYLRIVNDLRSDDVDWEPLISLRIDSESTLNKNLWPPYELMMYVTIVNIFNNWWFLRIVNIFMNKNQWCLRFVNYSKPEGSNQHISLIQEGYVDKFYATSLALW